ncbi:MAG: cysteine--tRNA ligase, partial [Arsenophonus sp. ET-DL12-MAG3]
AAENGKTCDTLTSEMLFEMYKDFDSLNILRPDFEPRVTCYIKEIIDLIKRLIKRGNAYIADNGDIMFAINSYRNYGSLSRQNFEQLEAGARVKVPDAKLNPLDFVLWKMSKQNEPSWSSPWGEGRPG